MPKPPPREVGATTVVVALLVVVAVIVLTYSYLLRPRTSELPPPNVAPVESIDDV